MSDTIFFYDSSKCTGCNACSTACKVANDLPVEENNSMAEGKKAEASLSCRTWSLVTEKSQPGKKSYPIIGYDLHMCRHCQNPPCMAFCTVDAITVNHGRVIVNQNLCIGCRECVYACPYNAIGVAEKSYDTREKKKRIVQGKAYKCDNCYSRKIEDPSCAAACPTGALSYGNRYSLYSLADKRLKEVKKEYPQAFIYGKKEMGGLRVVSLYIMKKSMYNLP